MKNILILLTVVLFTACQSKQESSTSNSSTSSNDVALNQLTEQQKDDGWKLLFNGKNTEGFRIFKNKESNSWEVVDGMLHCKPFDDADKRADIMTTDVYENFVLAFDWKVGAQGNTGVMFRVTEQYDEPYFSGPEYQLIDDEGYPGDLQVLHITGANYDMQAPTRKSMKRAGEWNSSRLVVDGDHVEHWLNGEKVIEYEINSEEWINQKNNSKWKDAEGYGAATKGFIDFQDHGSEVWFRNIMIKTL